MCGHVILIISIIISVRRHHSHTFFAICLDLIQVSHQWLLIKFHYNYPSPRLLILMCIHFIVAYMTPEQRAREWKKETNETKQLQQYTNDCHSHIGQFTDLPHLCVFRRRERGRERNTYKNSLCLGGNRLQIDTFDPYRQ